MYRYFKIAVFIIAVCTLLTALTFSLSALAQDRVALVIGNDRYSNLPADKQLAKAVNDASAVGAALEKIGFTVIRGENLDRQGMIDRVFAFTQKIKPGDTAVMFYAGHGIAVSGGNYLLPTDVRPAAPGEEARVRNMAIGEADIVADIQEKKARVTVLMLDACRDNPFRQPGLTRSVGVSRGLTRAAEGEGVFSVYSAGFGQAALDSLGPDDKSPNSVFTRVLAPALSRTDAALSDLIIDVRESVAKLAATIDHQQYPAYYDQTRGGRVYLAPRSIAVQPAAPTLPPASAASPIVSNQLNEKVAVIAPPVRPGSHCGSQSSVGVSLSSRSAQPLSASEECALKPKNSFKECNDCPEIVVVPAGRFSMGWAEINYQHNVTISNSFAVGRFAVTFDEWDACVADNGCNGYRPADRGWGRGLLPVIHVSWNDAQAYVAWLSRKTGKNYRLLSEAEREYVTRAGTTTKYWLGNSISKQQANFGASKTVPVDSFQANPWGLYQVHGNVREWVEDCWHDSYNGAPTNGSVWVGGNCGGHVVRGGGWPDYDYDLWSAARGSISTTDRDSDNGFRVARTLTW